MTIVDIVCMVLISVCTFSIGYLIAMLKIGKAIERTIHNISLNEEEFARGALWAVEYTMKDIWK